MKKKILLAFDDPGGGLAVSSLLEKINSEIDSYQIIYAGKHSIGFLNNINTENTEVREIASFISKKEAERIFENEKPDILITGTGGGNAEQELRNVAYHKNTKSIVILDFWKDYSRRWKYAEYSKEEMKDLICVMDDLTKEEMESDNFISENLIVTGHPYLDRIFNHKSGDRADKKGNDIIENFLFLSQPLEIIGVKEYDIHPLETFLDSLRKFTDQKNQKLIVKIKLHPSEQTSEEIIDITEKYNRKLTEVEIVSQENLLSDLIADSDIVAGYNTIALFEARAAGRKVISIRVAEMNNSLSHSMADAGIEIVEPDIDAIINCIIKKNKASADNRKFSGGIANCVTILKKELSLN